VLPVGTRYESAGTGSSIEIVDRSEGGMTFERLYKPGAGGAHAHLHQDFVQTWEAMEGEGRIEVEGAERESRAGDRVEVPLDTPHRDPYNPGGGDLRARDVFDPVTEFVERYAEAWAHHFREGSANSKDEMPLLQILLLARETDGRSYRAGVPVGLSGRRCPWSPWIARLRGYKAAHD
jgi:mannose-6-phosphate isomerase-like protein (cupin superfamily)